MFSSLLCLVFVVIDLIRHPLRPLMTWQSLLEKKTFWTQAQGQPTLSIGCIFDGILHHRGNGLDGHGLHTRSSVREVAKGGFRGSFSVDVSSFPCLSGTSGSTNLAERVIYSIQYKRGVSYAGNGVVFHYSRYWSKSLSCISRFKILEQILGAGSTIYSTQCHKDRGPDLYAALI